VLASGPGSKYGCIRVTAWRLPRDVGGSPDPKLAHTARTASTYSCGAPDRQWSLPGEDTLRYQVEARTSVIGCDFQVGAARSRSGEGRHGDTLG
jgi:hypothetical protein